MTEGNTILADKAFVIRRNIAKMYYRAGWGHFAPALSCVDIMVAIFFGKQKNGESFFKLGNDHFVLSKGHGCAALYAALAEIGMIGKKELNTFYQNDSRLLGLASPTVEGIDIPTGSLGHGICFATGTALAAQIDGSDYRTFVVLGDGESQEGSVWEAAEFAGSHKLSKLIVVMDCNGFQASDSIHSILPLNNTLEKWKSFGWNVICADGHDYSDLSISLGMAVEEHEKPSIIMARTIKGKGVKIAENKSDWHSRAPKGVEWDAVCNDLKLSRTELESI